MEDVVNLIALDSSPSEISNAIKNALYSKAASKVDSMRPDVARSLFGEDESNEEYSDNLEDTNNADY